MSMKNQVTSNIEVFFTAAKELPVTWNNNPFGALIFAVLFGLACWVIVTWLRQKHD